MQYDTKYWLGTYKKLDSDRMNWVSRWQEAAEYTCPIFADFEIEKSKGEEKGHQTRLKRNDATAIRCVNLFAKTIHSLIFPPTQKNVEFKDDGLDNPSSQAREWLSTGSDIIQNEFNISNLDAELTSCFKILGWHGTPVVYFGERYDKRIGRDVFDFKTLHPKEIYTCDTLDKRPSRFIRKYKLTLAEILATWPKFNSNEKVTERANNNDLEELEVIHCVWEDRFASSNKRFKDMTIILGIKPSDNSDEELSVEGNGYRTFPYLIMPWEPIPGERYSNSLAMDAMPHIKTLNDFTGIFLDYSEKQVNPPILEDQGCLVDGSLDLGSAARNKCNDINGIKALIDYSGAGNVSYQVLAPILQRQIEQLFYIDQMQLPPMEGTPHTAYEIQVRVEFMQRVLGPMYGTHRFLFMDMLMDRAINLALENKLLRDIPEEILEGGFHPVYVGPLSKAQKLTESIAIRRFLQDKISIMSAFPAIAQTNPELMVNINWSFAERSLAEADSVPQSIFVNDEDELQARVEKIQQAQEAAQQAELMGQAADAYKSYQTGQKMAQGG